MELIGGGVSDCDRCLKACDLLRPGDGRTVRIGLIELSVVADVHPWVDPQPSRSDGLTHATVPVTVTATRTEGERFTHVQDSLLIRLVAHDLL